MQRCILLEDRSHQCPTRRRDQPGLEDAVGSEDAALRSLPSRWRPRPELHLLCRSAAIYLQEVAGNPLKTCANTELSRSWRKLGCCFSIVGQDRAAISHEPLSRLYVVLPPMGPSGTEWGEYSEADDACETSTRVRWKRLVRVDTSVTIAQNGVTSRGCHTVRNNYAPVGGSKCRWDQDRLRC